MKKNIETSIDHSQEREYALGVAQTIMGQIAAGIGKSALWSWGIVAGGATFINGKDGEDIPALALGVDARLFSGIVTVALNWSDAYEVWLQKSGEKTAELIGEEIYCDQIGEFIDRKIESGDNWEEYEKFCRGEKAKMAEFLN
ncbi:MAG: hypothetical protein LIP09_14165 [Bacteroidales bacterium]|nr:hypothetical protein [Bacteroidales bacterium]MCC8119873.1 hypothetical protein [Bacteroidales bacterium]